MHAASKRLRRWPLALIALPAAVAIWNGWVGLGGMTGFGPVHPLPGIRPGLVINTAITLPVGLEAYAAYALAAWLGPWQVSARARWFAMWSALGSLGLGMSGQIAFHLLTAWHQRTAPGLVIVLVACVPVIVVGLASGLTHLLRQAPAEEAQPERPGSEWQAVAGPLVSALAARIAPRAAAPVPPATGTAAAAPVPVAGPLSIPIATPAENLAAIGTEPPPTTPIADPTATPIATPVAGPAATGTAAPTADRAAKAGPGAVRKVQRKGARDSTDDEMKAAIREMRDADEERAWPTKYKVMKELGPGKDRAQRLLDEVKAERPLHLAVSK